MLKLYSQTIRPGLSQIAEDKNSKMEKIKIQHYIKHKSLSNIIILLTTT